MPKCKNWILPIPLLFCQHSLCNSAILLKWLVSNASVILFNSSSLSFLRMLVSWLRKSLGNVIISQKRKTWASASYPTKISNLLLWVKSRLFCHVNSFWMMLYHIIPFCCCVDQLSRFKCLCVLTSSPPSFFSVSAVLSLWLAGWLYSYVYRYFMLVFLFIRYNISRVLKVD